MAIPTVMNQTMRAGELRRSLLAKQDPMNFAVQQRMRFIDLMLEQYGHIGRQTIADYFGLSAVQASLDLKGYNVLAPGNARYEPAMKSHVALPGFKRAFS